MSGKERDYGLWVLLGLCAAWFGYNFLYDETRQGHPNYKPDYERCARNADIIYNDNLEEAIADPSIWRLAGYTSATDFAERTRRGVIGRCN